MHSSSIFISAENVKILTFIGFFFKTMIFKLFIRIQFTEVCLLTLLPPASMPTTELKENYMQSPSELP